MADTLKSYVDRILRLKEQQDDLQADIRDIYTEAKASGLDRTIMGQLVGYLRKREKNPEKVSEQTSLFDTYLNEYERGEVGTRNATHAAREQQTTSRGGNVNLAQAPTLPAESRGDTISATLSPSARPSPSETHPVTASGADNDAVLNSPETAHVTPDADIRATGRGGHPVPPLQDQPATAIVPVAEQSAGDGSRDRRHVHPRQTDDARHGGQDQSAAALDHAPNSPSAPCSSQAAEQTGAVVTPPSAAPVAQSNRAEIMRRYRPNCQRPDACSSSVLDHCYGCKTAMAASEAA